MGGGDADRSDGEAGRSVGGCHSAGEGSEGAAGDAGEGWRSSGGSVGGWVSSGGGGGGGGGGWVSSGGIIGVEGGVVWRPKPHRGVPGVDHRGVEGGFEGA